MTCRKVVLPAIDEGKSLKHLSSSCSMHATGTSWLAHTSSDAADHADSVLKTGLRWLTRKVMDSAMIREKGWLAPVTLQRGLAAL